MKQSMLFIFYLVFFISCECPKIEFTDSELIRVIDAIKRSEVYMKKIPTVPNIAGEYATFSLSDDTLKIVESVYKYNPNDSTREGRLNLQPIDTCTVFPGLNQEEFLDLKKQLHILKNAGVYYSEVAHDINGKFRFFYYIYSPVRHKYDSEWDFYLAVFDDPIIPRDPDFLIWYNILDNKGSLYLMTYRQ